LSPAVVIDRAEVYELDLTATAEVSVARAPHRRTGLEVREHAGVLCAEHDREAVYIDTPPKPASRAQ